MILTDGDTFNIELPNTMQFTDMYPNKSTQSASRTVSGDLIIQNSPLNSWPVTLQTLPNAWVDKKVIDAVYMESQKQGVVYSLNYTDGTVRRLIFRHETNQPTIQARPLPTQLRVEYSSDSIFTDFSINFYEVPAT